MKFRCQRMMESSNHAIKCIKAIYDLTGQDLRTSKEFFDRMRDRSAHEISTVVEPGPGRRPVPDAIAREEIIRSVSQWMIITPITSPFHDTVKTMLLEAVKAEAYDFVRDIVSAASFQAMMGKGN